MPILQAHLAALTEMALQQVTVLKARIVNVALSERQKTQALLAQCEAFLGLLNASDPAEKLENQKKFADALAKKELSMLGAASTFKLQSKQVVRTFNELLRFLQDKKLTIQNDLECQLLGVALYLMDALAGLSSETAMHDQPGQARTVSLCDISGNKNFIRRNCAFLGNHIYPLLKTFIDQNATYANQADAYQASLEKARAFLMACESLPEDCDDATKIESQRESLAQFLKDQTPETCPSIIIRYQAERSAFSLMATHDFSKLIQTLFEQHDRLKNRLVTIQQDRVADQEKADHDQAEKALSEQLTVLIQRYQAAFGGMKNHDGDVMPVAAEADDLKAPLSTPVTTSRRARWNLTKPLKMAGQVKLGQKEKILKHPTAQMTASSEVHIDAEGEIQARLRHAKDEMTICENALLQHIQKIDSQLSAEAPIENIRLQVKLVLGASSLEQKEQHLNEVLRGVIAVQAHIQTKQTQLDIIANPEIKSQMDQVTVGRIDGLQARFKSHLQALDGVIHTVEMAKQKNQHTKNKNAARQALAEQLITQSRHFIQSKQHARWWDVVAEIFLSWFFVSTRKRYESYAEHVLHDALMQYGQTGDQAYFRGAIQQGQRFKRRLSIAKLLTGFDSAVRQFDQKLPSSFDQIPAAALTTERLPDISVAATMRPASPLDKERGVGKPSAGGLWASRREPSRGAVAGVSQAGDGIANSPCRPSQH